MPRGGRPKHAQVCGFVANFPGCRDATRLRRILQACLREEPAEAAEDAAAAPIFSPDPIFEEAGRDIAVSRDK